MNLAKNVLKKIVVCTIIMNTIILWQLACYAACPHDNLEYEDQNNGRHEVYCLDCGTIFSEGTHSYGVWNTTRYATCTQTGERSRLCKYCGAEELEYISMLDHDWSNWLKSSEKHWKECENCDAIDLEATHTDVDADGYCDECEHLMAIPASATISDNVTVKAGEDAIFFITVTKGTAPITYQWYYNTSNSTENGIPISGEEQIAIAISPTDKSMNGRYYYCAMKNNAGIQYSPTALLTVYYPFTIATQPQDANLKKGESATFSVSVGEKGNPDEYTYQWYVAPSESEEGSKINGATSASYTITPTRNIHEEYYYCLVSNGQYTISSERAKLVTDVTLPEITMGTFDDNRIINTASTVKIPFTVTDTGEGYTETEPETNFTASDIIVKIGGVEPSSVNKTLDFIEEGNGSYQYELTLTNISGNEKLTLEIPADSIADDFQNKNLEKTFTTKLTLDNVSPEIQFESITSGLNGVYANAEDTLIIRLTVTDAGGMNSSLFTTSDIEVLVGGSTANTDIEKELTYLEKEGNKYIYQLTLNNIKGDGSLSLNIPADSFVDLASNVNVVTSLDITTNENSVIIDNTKPVINTLITTLGAYNDTSRVYPDSLDSRYQGWSKENIFVQIDATNNHEIDYYLKSTNGINYSKITSNQEEISQSIQATMYYKAVDMAGNISDPFNSDEIKLDKTIPDKPKMLITQQREGGAAYIYNKDVPTTRSVYVKADASTIVDKGPVKSGIYTAQEETYFTITTYKELGDTTPISVDTFAYNGGKLLEDTGYYEVRMYMTDIAGNSIQSDLYQIYINKSKSSENTIRIKNINDIGSGVVKATIRIYQNNKDGEEVITPIVIENPYKEIVKNVRLGKGTFYVEATLEDKVGNDTVLFTTLQNNF